MSKHFKQFIVHDKVVESSIITSFYLIPKDDIGDDISEWEQAKAGQYLTIRIPHEPRNLLRNYSISNDVDDKRYFRITVKRESAPVDKPDMADGIGSCWLHDNLQKGDKIDVAKPRGKFFLNQQSNKPVLLLSGGVGQTPLLAMLHQLAKSNRSTYFIHACQNGEVHAMQQEVQKLIAGKAHIRSYVAYAQPTQQDRENQRFNTEGYITKQILQSLLPASDCEIYMCGPSFFMATMFHHLIALGVAEDNIAYEFFGNAQSLKTLALKI